MKIETFQPLENRVHRWMSTSEPGWKQVSLLQNMCRVAKLYIDTIMHAHIYIHMCWMCMCLLFAHISCWSREHKLRTRAELDCSQDLLFIFQPFFYMVRPWKTALTQQVDYSISAYSTRQQGRKVIYHGFSFSTLKGVTIRPKMTGHQSLWSWHGLNKSKHRSLTDWPVIFTLKPIVWVWKPHVCCFNFILLVLSREWMGMGEWDDYY